MRRRRGRGSASTADVTTTAGVTAVVDGAVARLGGLDIVVNNVGGSGARDFADTDEADLRAVLDRNLFPALRVSRAALPHLRARGGGAIVMIASIWGREAGGGPSYNVAKAAEISLAKAMARDLARDNIRVNSVAPGSVLFPGGGWERRQKADPTASPPSSSATSRSAASDAPKRSPTSSPSSCSPRACWITGACIPVDGGQSRAF